MKRVVFLEDTFSDRLVKKMDKEIDMIDKLKLELIDVRITTTAHGTIAVIFFDDGKHHE